MGELGYSQLDIFLNHSVYSINTNSVTAGLSAGIQINWFELSLRYTFDISDDHNGLLGARIGFNF